MDFVLSDWTHDTFTSPHKHFGLGCWMVAVAATVSTHARKIVRGREAKARRWAMVILGRKLVEFFIFIVFFYHNKFLGFMPKDMPFTNWLYYLSSGWIRFHFLLRCCFLCARHFFPPSRNSFCYSYKEMVTNFFFTATNGKNTDLFSFTPIHPSTISWLIELSLLCVWKAK